MVICLVEDDSTISYQLAASTAFWVQMLSSLLRLHQEHYLRLRQSRLLANRLTTIPTFLTVLPKRKALKVPFYSAYRYVHCPARTIYELGKHVQGNLFF